MKYLTTLIVALCVAAGLYAEQPNASESISAGDTIIVPSSQTHYLTGEKISSWVYKVPHVVKQVGGKRFPEGIWLKGINSWVSMDGLVKEQTTTPTSQQAESSTAEELSGKEKEKVTESVQDSVESQPEAAKGTVEVQPAEEGTGLTEIEPSTHVTINLASSYNRFSIGLRGGVSQMMFTTTIPTTNTLGYEALLDLQYAHYWRKQDRPIDLGIVVGLSFGWCAAGVETKNYSDAFTVSTSEGNVPYTITADRIKEKDGQLQVEIPVYFSLLHHNGLFFNVGPKFILPCWTPFTQTIQNGHVDAYLSDIDVHVIDDDLMGKITTGQSTIKGTNTNQFKPQVGLAAEIGYEWKFENGHALGLGAYGGYNFFSLYNNTGSLTRLIEITGATATSNAILTPHEITNTYATRLTGWSAGVKLAYHIQ